MQYYTEEVKRIAEFLCIPEDQLLNECQKYRKKKDVYFEITLLTTLGQEVLTLIYGQTNNTKTAIKYHASYLGLTPNRSS